MLLNACPYPPVGGGSITNFNLLKHLSAWCDIDLLSFAWDPADFRRADALLDYCRSVWLTPWPRRFDQLRALTSMLAGRSYYLSRYVDARMQVRAREMLSARDYDVVHVGMLQMMQFVPSDTRIPVVLHAHNVESQLIKSYTRAAPTLLHRLYAWQEWKKLDKLEIGYWHQASAIATVSSEDRRTVLKMAPGLGIPVVEIRTSLDTGEYSPLRFDPASVGVMTAGTLSWRPNVYGLEWFVSEVWPRIRQLSPCSGFDIVGRNPSPRLTRLAGNGVKLVGFVEDLRPYVAANRVFVVPLLAGGGVRVKILTAMALGIPVVSTSLGAAGLQVQDGTHLLLADSPAEFADRVLRLLRDDALWRRLSENGRRLVEAEYDCAPGARRLFEEVYLPLTSRVR